MKLDKPLPLFPTHNELKHIRLSDYPAVQTFLTEPDAPSWRLQHWQWAVDFLKYMGRNKSEHTYSRFRNETERFLTWLFVVKQQPMDDLRKRGNYLQTAFLTLLKSKFTMKIS